MTHPYNPWDPRPSRSATLTRERAEKSDHWIRMRVTLEIDVPPGPTPDDVARIIHEDVIVIPGHNRPMTVRSTAVDKPFDTWYHSMDRIANLRHTDLADVLGKPIFWTVKVDGSCIGCTLNEEGSVHLHTREMPQANPHIYGQFDDTGRANQVWALLRDIQSVWGTTVVFGELLVKGGSPQGIKVYDASEFVVFDILTKRKGYLPYPEVAKLAKRFDIPVVGCLGTTTHDTLDGLLAQRDEFVGQMQEQSIEGVVGKVWRYPGDPLPIFFKEKWKPVKASKEPKTDNPEKPTLPDLPDDEIRSAINRAWEELGPDFTTIKIAMPVVVRYVGMEARKHGCAMPKNVVNHYTARCESELKKRQST